MLIAATQLYVWSQLYHRQGKDLETGMNDILGEVATAGYQGMEGQLTFCATPEKAQVFRTLLSAHGLNLTSLYTGGCYYDPERAPKSLEELLPLAERAAG